MLIEWSDDLVLGVDTMDETHREFVAQLNAVAGVADEAMLAALDRFIEHTEAHFGQEERWMESMNFPPLHCHRDEHQGVLGIMREVRGMVADGKFEIGRVLARELAPWFTNHAATMDAMLAQFILAKGVDTGAAASA